MKTRFWAVVFAIMAMAVMAGPAAAVTIESTGSSNGYVVRLPASLDGLHQDVQEGTWPCGSNNAPVAYKDTNFFFRKKVSGLTEWSQVTMKGRGWMNFGIEDLSGAAIPDPKTQSVSVFLAFQGCSEEIDVNYETGICTVTPGLVCGEVYESDLLGKTVRLRIYLDKPIN